MTNDFAALRQIAREIRGHLIEMSHRTGAPHLGSSLSCVDILVAAYWTALTIEPERPKAPERDRLLLSKGHAATTLYAALAFLGWRMPAAPWVTGCLLEWGWRSRDASRGNATGSTWS
jgi:transketolase